MLWRLTTGWRRFSGTAGSAFDPLRGPKTNRPIGVVEARAVPVVSRIQRRHDRHFRPFLPIAVRRQRSSLSRDNNSAVSLRNSADTLCRRTAAQRLHDANTASGHKRTGRQAGGMPPVAGDDEEISANVDDLRSRRNARDRLTFYSAEKVKIEREKIRRLKARKLAKD